MKNINLPDLERPVFIIGAARSGTTMLGELLSRHPDVAYWLEPKYIWRYGNPLASDDVRSAGEADSKTKRYIRNRFARFLKKRDKARFVEKTPSNVFRIAFINAVFPDALFVYLIRDGRDVVLSAEKKWTTRPDKTALWRRLTSFEIPLRDFPFYFMSFLRDVPGRIFFPSKGFIWGPQFPGIESYRASNDVLTTCAKQWIESVEYSINDIKQIDQKRVFKLRYEDLLNKPEEMLAAILSFADLNGDALTDMLKGFKLRPAKEQSREDLERIEKINIMIEDKRRELGYS